MDIGTAKGIAWRPVSLPLSWCAWVLSARPTGKPPAPPTANGDWTAEKPRVNPRTVRESVVLIAYHFPPDPAVGSLRAAKVARAFRDAGHRVDVVTACLPTGRELRST